MKQLTFYITILYCAYCVCSDVHLTNTPTVQRISKNGTYSSVSVAPKEQFCQTWGKTDKSENKINQDDGRMIMSKPKLVVTFLANSKTFDKPDLGGGMEPPLFFDPFQRLLQFFFSSFTRDITPRLPDKEETAIKDKSEKIDSSDFDWFGKKDEGSPILCEHGMNGYCRTCHMQSKNMLDPEKQTTKKRDYPYFRINISNSLTTQKSDHHDRVKKSNGTGAESTTGIHSTTPDPGTTKKMATKHKRHYFLSISGGTDKRAAAPQISEIKRIKRNTSSSNSESFFKILEDTILETLNKDGGIIRKQDLEALTASTSASASISTSTEETNTTWTEETNTLSTESLNNGVFNPSDGSKPDPSAPDGSKPDPSAPDGSKPDPSAPDGSKPDPSAPDGSKPDPSAPDGSKPDPSAPDGSKPDPSAPDGSKPDPSAPDGSKPNPSAPDGSKPNPSAPDESTPNPSAPDESTPNPSAPDESKPNSSAPDESKPNSSAPDPSKLKPSTPDPSKPKPSSPDESKPKPTTPSQSKPKPSSPDQSKPKPTTPSQSKPKPSTPGQSKPKPSTPGQSKPKPATSKRPNTGSTKPVSVGPNKSSTPNPEEKENDSDVEEDDFGLYDESIPPHVAEYSHGMSYLFIITLPVVCILVIVIGLLCIFLRTRGRCCRLFLDDPRKTLDARNARKGQRARKKEKEVLLA